RAAPPHPPSTLRVVRRPLPHTVGERWGRCDTVNSAGRSREEPKIPPLPHRVGERSPKSAPADEAGEGALSSAPGSFAAKSRLVNANQIRRHSAGRGAGGASSPLCSVGTSSRCHSRKPP